MIPFNFIRILFATLFAILLLFSTQSMEVASKRLRNSQFFSQETPLSPMNNPVDRSLLKPETSEMSWSMLKDSLKIQLGTIRNRIQKKKGEIYIVTTVNMKQSSVKWIDTTIVDTLNFRPIYHSSFNQQRDMALKFGEKITGYYYDRQSNVKTQISEKSDTPFFDSNFYPVLVRLLPLKDNYSNTISIFDYNPKSKTGVMTATVRNTKSTAINFNGETKQVWKVETTDDISNNSTISTYYIERSTRRILKQEINFGNRKMLLELMDLE